MVVPDRRPGRVTGPPALYLDSTKQVGLMALFMVTIGFTAAPTVQAGDKHGVVIQMSDDDADKWNLALNNAKNFQKELGKDKIDIEIVAFGPGISMLKKDSTVASRMDEAMMSGVKIIACQNTLKAQKLTEKRYLSQRRVRAIGSGGNHAETAARLGLYSAVPCLDLT